MKIVFSTDQIYLHGGIEKVMTQKANYFSDVLGYEVIIITTEQCRKKPCYELSNNIRLLDLEINYQREKSYFSATNLSKIPFHFWQTKKVLKELNPDVLIVVNYSFDFYWLPFLNRVTPKWKEFHSSRYFEILERQEKQSILRKIRFGFENWIESKYTKLIVLNPDEKGYYKNTNVEIIPNPISGNNLNATLSSNKVIAAGRIAPVKGFENAILSWKLVAASKPNWELHIYGDGDVNYINELQSLIVKSELENNVFIKSAVGDLQGTMLDYAVYLMTSHTECFPMVLLEALSVGLPVVSFDCPTGPKNIITSGLDGVLVENQNRGALAEQLLLLMEGGEKRIRMGKAAKLSSERFSMNIVMQKWNKMIIDL